ncbi:hypothetical protein AW878_07590 [Bordetella pseudohinzii]|uniref:Uncharacterized protein n=1 Tax=Bordetella pseudohinzii TaxID=1331258 RepID=A0ABN4RUR1_9BORD|nr:hypothetical protein BBN53_16235 [Bordetella pseudohinzii]KMM24438.1 hypothetical protein L540_06475 [Bordetella pseudohinzii]KXA80461.1 hypothetical protein AW878_07590 [Bordetella pseudohinzii]KXA80744.1 hypothetical protein AW877_05785 [Bordetella pseudohinzii]
MAESLRRQLQAATAASAMTDNRTTSLAECRNAVNEAMAIQSREFSLGATAEEAVAAQAETENK